MEVIHQGLVLEFAFETAWVANAVPGFDADEGGVLLVGAPKGDDGGAELYGHFSLACLVEQFGTAYLALVDLHAVVAARSVR